ncbi:MAG: 7-carboxy-7-deazaguanine synthase QueE, partial [Ktedonobacterales bacterium]
MSKSFPVVELFGPVLQGEGRMIGTPTLFARFGYCDYRCSWCDTLYAVLPEEVQRTATQMTASEIRERLRALDPTVPWVTLSGGNPAMHDLSELVDL